MSSDEQWVKLRPGNAHSWEEKQPYEECPNCGRYEYRKMRLYHAGIIRCIILGKDPYYTVYSSCKNCKYSTEEEEISVEGRL